jgi:hypothetical protein
MSLWISCNPVASRCAFTILQETGYKGQGPVKDSVAARLRPVATQ